MSRVNIDFNKKTGKIKIMHAVNNGPARQTSEEFVKFRELEIPYCRNHDASLSEPYGPQRVVDVHCIFPDFSKDENDEHNYDFTLTDIYNQTIMAAGAKVFYRLGSSIEHWEKKYGTLVPADFEKWARICEHIIMHYNEGWANGFNFDIEYWEIWNEADLSPDDEVNKRTWGGTKAQFFEFYAVAARYLKKRFPNIKIGGPASCGNISWMDDFLEHLDAPLDFFSFHMYSCDPYHMVRYATAVKNLLIEHGYGEVETVLNEWNWVRDWQNRLEYVTAIHGMKSAAFVAATMCAVQNCGLVDMLMYYDARLYTPWNGLFDFYTAKPLKAYYSIKMFSQLYRLGTQTKCESDDGDIFATSATDGENCAAIIAYYSFENAEDKTVTLNTGLSEPMECYLLDEENDMLPVGSINDGDRVTMRSNSVIFLKK